MLFSLAVKTLIMNLRYRRNITGKFGCFRVHKHSKLQINKTSNININNHLFINANDWIHNGRTSILRMDSNSRLNVDSFTFMYGADIILFPDAELNLGRDSFINSDCKIRCHKKISIGNDCAISHDFTIMDSDAHKIIGDDNAPKEIEIGNHVWIGTRVTILKGVTIGDGAIVAACSLVNKDVPPKTLVAGIPARVIRENVEWEK